MGIITFNNITSSSLGVEVETFPNYEVPAKEYQVTHVPGRNGDLVVDTKTFQNVPRSYEVSVATNGVPIEVVNAAVARFKSSSRMPIKSLSSEIKAVQDLHGYNHPWVGGAGKNKLEDTFNTGTFLGVDITADNGVIDLNGTGTGSNSFAIKSRNTSGNYIYMPKGNYIFSAQGIGSGVVVGTTYNGAFYEIERNDNGEFVGFSITDNTPSDYKQSDGSVLLSLYISISARTYNHQKVYPMIRLASETDATFEPYSNVCLISGHTETNLVACGKNFYHGTLYNGQIGSNGGYSSANTRISNVNGSEISKGALYLKSGSYILSISGLDYCTVLTKDNNNNIVDNFAFSWHDLPYTFTLTNDAYLFFTARKSDNSNITPSDYSPMIRLSSIIDETYEQYNGNTYTFNFGQTVYGGHFDNNGNLVVTHSFIASYNGETINEPWISSMDNYVPNTLPSIGAQVKYPLTTPITLAITSQDISTLLGENNIFSNCGDVSVKVNPSFSTIINQVAEWLHSASGYARLEDTYEPDYYRMAYYAESVSIENLFNEAGKATLNFICKPQRYLKSGETPVSFTEEGTIQNGTRFASSPVLKVITDNTQGSISIGNHTIAIKAGAGTDPITIDCELQDAWSGTTNKNPFIILTDGEFPVIDPGTQTITFDGGVQSVEVTPRWWTV